MSDDNKELRDLMVQDAGTGFEDLESSDFSAPFLIILQNGSPQLNEQNTLYISDAKPGRIFNTQSNGVYREVTVIPIRYTFRHVEWKPRNSGGGFVASYDRKSTPNDLVTDALTGLIGRSNGNLLQPTGYYLCLLVEEGYDKVIIPMYSTQLKKSRKWNSMMISHKEDEAVLPMFSQQYRLSVVQESNSKGTWYGWQIQHAGEVTDTSVYQLAKTTHNAMINFLPERLVAAIAKQTGNEDVV